MLCSRFSRQKIKISFVCVCVCDILKNSWLLQQFVTIGVFLVSFPLRKCILYGLYSVLYEIWTKNNIKITACLENRKFSIECQHIVLLYSCGISLMVYDIITKHVIRNAPSVVDVLHSKHVSCMLYCIWIYSC